MFVAKCLRQGLVLSAALLWGLIAHAYEAADTNVIGQPLEGEYFVIDMNASGRYLLLANFDPALASQLDDGAPCRIWRKDTGSGDIRTGDLELVFESNQRFNYCAGAKISANGRYVATAPGQSVSADQGVCDAPGARVQALQVKDLDTGDIRRVWRRWQPEGANEIARVCILASANAWYPPQNIYALSGNGKVAALQSVFGFEFDPEFELLDVETGMIESLADKGAVTSLALSHNGARVAMTVRDISDSGDVLPGTLAEQPSGPSAVLICGQTGRCDRLPGAPSSDADSGTGTWWNQYNKEVLSLYGNRLPDGDDCESWWQCPELAPSTVSIQILRRSLDKVRRPAKLRKLSRLTSLRDGGWSRNGKRLSWIEYPDRSAGWCSGPTLGDAVCEPSGCTAEECELTAHTFFTSTRKLRSQTTTFDPTTLTGCHEYAPEPMTSNYVSPGIDCTAKLSRNGNYMLYPRSVRYPFNDGWQPNALAIKDFVCADRLSLETPLMDPETIPCPAVYPDAGPFISIHEYDRDTDYINPVLWYVRNLQDGWTQLVSTMPGDNLFTTNKAMLSANGTTLAFQSRDPVAVKEAQALHPGCSWSPFPMFAMQLSLATGDTTKTVAEDDFIVYPATPTLCAVPEPRRDSRVVVGQY